MIKIINSWNFTPPFSMIPVGKIAEKAVLGVYFLQYDTVF